MAQLDEWTRQSIMPFLARKRYASALTQFCATGWLRCGAAPGSVDVLLQQSMACASHARTCSCCSDGSAAARAFTPGTLMLLLASASTVRLDS